MKGAVTSNMQVGSDSVATIDCSSLIATLNERLVDIKELRTIADQQYADDLVTCVSMTKLQMRDDIIVAGLIEAEHRIWCKRNSKYTDEYIAWQKSRPNGWWAELWESWVGNTEDLIEPYPKFYVPDDVMASKIADERKIAEDIYKQIAVGKWQQVDVDRYWPMRHSNDDTPIAELLILKEQDSSIGNNVGMLKSHTRTLQSMLDLLLSASYATVYLSMNDMKNISEAEKFIEINE